MWGGLGQFWVLRLSRCGYVGLAVRGKVVLGTSEIIPAPVDLMGKTKQSRVLTHLT